MSNRGCIKDDRFLESVRELSSQVGTLVRCANRFLDSVSCMQPFTPRTERVHLRVEANRLRDELFEIRVKVALTQMHLDSFAADVPGPSNETSATTGAECEERS